VRILSHNLNNKTDKFIACSERSKNSTKKNNKKIMQNDFTETLRHPCGLIYIFLRSHFIAHFAIQKNYIVNARDEVIKHAQVARNENILNSLLIERFPTSAHLIFSSSTTCE
jgi:hypothetical protein